jgi:hypothetical protein
MVPAVSRRSIPTSLLPHEVTDAHARLRTLRRQAVGFWAALLPMTWGIWQLVGLGVSGFLDTLLLTAGGGAALVAGRLYWWYGQRHERQHARRVLARWRRVPADPRWDAAMVLLDRIAMLCQGDPGLQETARRTATVLFVLYEDIARLKETLPADRVLDGEGEPSERYYRLLAVIRQREAQIETLLGGLRDLHIEMNEQLGNLLAEQPDSVHGRLQELMDRMEAEREITRAVGLRGVQVTSIL